MFVDTATLLQMSFSVVVVFVAPPPPGEGDETQLFTPALCWLLYVLHRYTSSIMAGKVVTLLWDEERLFARNSSMPGLSITGAGYISFRRVISILIQLIYHDHAHPLPPRTTPIKPLVIHIFILEPRPPLMLRPTSLLTLAALANSFGSTLAFVFSRICGWVRNGG